MEKPVAQLRKALCGGDASPDRQRLQELIEKVENTWSSSSGKSKRRKTDGGHECLHDAYMLMASRCELEGLYEEAEKYLKKGVALKVKEQEVLLGLAELYLRHLRRPGEAERLLRRIIALPASEFTAVAKYSLSLLLLSQGKPGDAESFLSELGFKYRLSDAVFRGETDGMSATSLVMTFDDQIVDLCLKWMSNAFSPANSKFWPAHNYDSPETGYFSYSFPLCDAPRFGVETFIKECIWPLVGPQFAGIMGDEGIFAEWWVHKRDPMSGHQLHWDTDEIGLRSGKAGFRTPIASTVLYLEQGSGAPTLIIDQRLGDEQLGQRAWFVKPKTNRLVAFSGALLHGVIPRFIEQEGTESSINKYRLTFMVGFWKDVCCSTPPTDGSFSANMILPTKPLPQWTGEMMDFPELKTYTLNPPKQTMPLEIPMVEPVWVPVPSKKKSKTKRGGDVEPVHFVGKYFLFGPEDLESEIMPLVNPSIEYLTSLLQHIGEMEDQEQEVDDLNVQFLCNILCRMWKENEEADDAQELLVEATSQSHEVRKRIITDHLEFLMSKLRSHSVCAIFCLLNVVQNSDHVNGLETKESLPQLLQDLHAHKQNIEDVNFSVANACALAHISTKYHHHILTPKQRTELTSYLLEFTNSSADLDLDLDSSEIIHAITQLENCEN